MSCPVLESESSEDYRGGHDMKATLEASVKERFSVPLLMRLSPRQIDRLDAVLASESVYSGRQDVVRRVIDVLREDDLSAADAPIGAGAVLDSATAEDLLEATAERRATCNELVDQVRAIKSLVDQIVKAGKKLAKITGEMALDEAAIDRMRVTLARIEDRLAVLSTQDSFSAALVEKHARALSATAMRTESYDVVFRLRLTPAQDARLEAVQMYEPSLRTRQDVVRRMIDTLFVDPSKKKPAPRAAALDMVTAQAALRAIADRSTSYAEIAAETREIGHLVNQVARTWNAAVLLGGGVLPEPWSLKSANARLEIIEERVASLVEQDGFTSEIVAALMREAR